MAQGLVAQRAWPLTASSLTSLLLLSVRVISGARRKRVLVNRWWSRSLLWRRAWSPSAPGN